MTEFAYFKPYLLLPKAMDLYTVQARQKAKPGEVYESSSLLRPNSQVLIHV